MPKLKFAKDHIEIAKRVNSDIKINEITLSIKLGDYETFNYGVAFNGNGQEIFPKYRTFFDTENTVEKTLEISEIPIGYIPIVLCLKPIHIIVSFKTPCVYLVDLLLYLVISECQQIYRDRGDSNHTYQPYGLNPIEHSSTDTIALSLTLFFIILVCAAYHSTSRLAVPFEHTGKAKQAFGKPSPDASLYAGYDPCFFTTYNTSEYPVIPLSALDKNNYFSITLFFGYASSAFPSSITTFPILVE
ncbi:hypothetical protein CONCODRAFT_3895 [Conidiobolus coronatus NRRL 28638]|uniref:Uncharacterized protein n=1 Tax=Conidiobolus coronatus (strain ATCC 28846 / CBS 209.66 / NRRL 28638) TaxID=796925 RepID=A0A137PDZ1_CONC2|nr:hypothetical protein CONCODRAFT_3895 [Conidiobolus coronatus NRRL 28638]|eukprot:KXN73224.1 hypothetical protein CONCODRAFT_3895 [Conidiobolus coronatus NRRL 28638]